MIERTLIIIKPDGLNRGIATEVLSRFEKVGLKLEGIKLVNADIEQAKKHYLYEDIAVRHNETVWNHLIDYLTEGPVIAAVFSGVSAIEIARKIVGATEPKQALPGTIRGDYCHQSYSVCDSAGRAVRNVVHASADLDDSKREIPVWFSENELISYKRNDDFDHYLK